MDFDNREQLKNRFLKAWNTVFSGPDEEEMSDAGREKFIVFLVAFILAMFLWLMVNLSRDYNLNVNLPITLGNIPPDRALAEELPNFATASITGEGWKLINIYNNPPRIYVDVTKQEVSLYDQVRQQMNATPELNVLKVQPLFLSLELEEKVEKKVPVRSNVSLTFEEQYGIVGEPVLVPDSVTVSGAASIVRDINSWETDSVGIEEAKEPVFVSIPLKKSGPLLELSANTVAFRADVSQYTEGEVRVDIQLRGMPSGQNLNFSPSSVTVKYNVPIQEYGQVQKVSDLFKAYVDYEQIRNDSTGFITPQIEPSHTSKYHHGVRSFRPREVAYYNIVGN